LDAEIDGGDLMPVGVRVIKGIVASVLSRAGFRLVRVAPELPIDLRGVRDPHALLYLGRRQALYDGVLEHGRGLGAYPLTLGGEHPFIAATVAALKTDRDNRLHTLVEVLAQYYQRWQPVSAAARLGLTARRSPALAATPAWVDTYPWNPEPLARTIAHKLARAPTALDGGPVDAHPTQGTKLCGPASPALIRHEAGRLLAVLTAMERDGYQRHDGPGGDPECIALIGPAAPWHWVVGRGHHRAAVAAAFGLESIPIRITNIIDRAHAAVWPNVRSGLFSQDAALRVFDDLLQGRGAQWSDYASAGAVPVVSRAQ
jgi:hypothetical protein